MATRKRVGDRANEPLPAQRAFRDLFRTQVLGRVSEIPAGRVTNYALVALWAGRPRAARQVGSVLRGLSTGEAERVPWHRVVNAQGGLSTYKVGSGELQRALLEAEGVQFDNRGRCDLARYGFTSGMIRMDAAGGVVGS